MDHQKAKHKRQLRRRHHVRSKITGTSERPRLSVFRSSKHIYAQLIDDLPGVTLAAVVKGGRRFSFNALVVVGDRNGRVSWGYGKANEVPPAVEKAAKDAQETLKRQRRVQMHGATIPHRVVGKFGASRVILVPAGP